MGAFLRLIDTSNKAALDRHVQNKSSTRAKVRTRKSGWRDASSYLGPHSRIGELMKRLMIATFVTALASTSFAQTTTETLVVTPSNLRGWSTADTRTGGTVGFILDSTAPAGTGALQLTTNATTTAKAQFMHAASTPLAEVTALSYYTKHNPSTLFASGDASYQLVVYLCGPGSGFTTFVFEPYQNGVVTPGVWQSWDVAAGQMWSSRTVNCPGAGGVVAGGGGAPFYTLEGLQAAFPGAVVVGFGVNIGSNNPSYDVEVDLVQFNETIYDFEVFHAATNPEDCKKGGWSTFTPPYKNQGQCVSATVPQ